MRPYQLLDARPAARTAYTACIPLAAALGLVLTQTAPRRACMHLPWRADLAGGPDQGVHRGVLAVLLDSVCGAAVMCALDNAQSFSTLSLRMEYPLPAPPGADLIAQAGCLDFDGEVAYVQADARAGEQVVARAAGTFIVVHGRAPLHALEGAGD